jgi:hypothetical protein
MSEYAQAAVTIQALINPAIFSSIEAGRDPKSQVADATGAGIASFG